MDPETKKNPSKRNKVKERKAIYEKNMELYNRFLSGNEEQLTYLILFKKGV